MKYVKRVLSLIGVAVLMAASMVTGGVSADEIETTLTVETSVPVCEDLVPSNISLRTTAIAFPGPGLTPTNPPSTTPLRQNASTQIDFRINECLDGNQWNVTVSVSDLTYGGNTLLANETVYVRGSLGVNNNQEFYLLRPVHPTSTATGGSLAQTDAHRSLATNVEGWIAYTGTPIKTSTGNQATPTGSPGYRYTQSLQLGIANVPANTPPGPYTATVTATLTVVEP